jgi:hypothetical protein
MMHSQKKRPQPRGRGSWVHLIDATLGSDYDWTYQPPPYPRKPLTLGPLTAWVRTRDSVEMEISVLRGCLYHTSYENRGRMGRDI